jgi:DNA-binding NtrC family response regulator
LQLSDREVSRRHLSLDGSDRPVRLADLGSTNGTFVNGVKVIEAELFGGEVIRLGRTALQIDVAAESKNVPLSEATCFGRVLGASAEMRRLYPLCEKLASVNVPIVIEGETGTGKEVLAESLHELGPRSASPFMVFDCTAVPANLVEAELFGHERGAFTGAHTARKGVLEQAHGGTLFLDEIGDLDLALQPKLLRAIQRGQFRPLGSDQWRSVDVRIIAATRRNLDQEVQAGRFRDDLFFRLAVARIELPPLRRRHGDVTLLAQAFWKEFGGTGPLPRAHVRRWEGYQWPGNVRELHNEVARHAALGELAQLERPTALATTNDLEQLLHLPFARARERLVADFERRYVAGLVAMHGGNVSRAAAASGLALRYFQLMRARHPK